MRGWWPGEGCEVRQSTPFVSSLWRWYLADAAIRVDTRSRFALSHKWGFGRGWVEGGGGAAAPWGRKKKERKEKTGGWVGGMGVGGGGGEERKRENVTTSFESRSLRTNISRRLYRVVRKCR